MPVIFVECIAGPDGKLLLGRRAIRFGTGLSATDNPTASLTGNGSAVTGITDIGIDPVTMAAALAGIDLEVTTILVDGDATVDGNLLVGSAFEILFGAVPLLALSAGPTLTLGAHPSGFGLVLDSRTTMQLQIAGAVKLGLAAGGFGVGAAAAAPPSYPARAGQLTDSTGGSVTSTLGAGITDAVAKNAIASLADRVNKLEALVYAAGLSVP